MKQGDTAYVIVGKLYLSVRHEAIYRAELIKKHPKSLCSGWKVKYIELLWSGADFEPDFDIGDTLNVGTNQVHVTLIEAVEKVGGDINRVEAEWDIRQKSLEEQLARDVLKVENNRKAVANERVENEKVRGDLLKLKMAERGKRGMR